MDIITNHHWRPFRYRDEVPPEILAEQFDYQDAEEVFDGFFCYRGFWYHLDQVMRGGAEGWHGYVADSFFSGIVLRLSDDGEEYQIGTYLA